MGLLCEISEVYRSLFGYGLVLFGYEVATISRFPNNTGLFCKRDLSKRLYFAKQTYIFEEATSHSQGIGDSCVDSFHSCVDSFHSCVDSFHSCVDSFVVISALYARLFLFRCWSLLIECRSLLLRFCASDI